MWLGWPMLAALVWSSVPAWFIGRSQKPRARALHNNVLSTDAKMRQADWMTSLAAAIGVLGIEFGWPWLDLLAAGVIALNVFWSGFRQLRHAARDLAGSAPTTIDGKPDPVTDRLAEHLKSLPWIADVEVRLREEGRLIFGEIYVVPRTEDRLIANLRDAARSARRIDWRISALTLMPVSAIGS